MKFALKVNLGTFLLSFLLINCSMAQEIKTIDDHLIRSVVNIDNSGTGFLVSKILETSKNLRKVYLVTNKHMIGKWSPVDSLQLKKSIKIKLYIKGSEFPYMVLESDLLDSNGKKFNKIQVHPDPKVDIAVLDITHNLIEIKEKSLADIDISTIDICTLLDLGDIERVTNNSIGDQVFALGYPSNITLVNSNEPVAKFGFIASRLSGDLVLKIRFDNRLGIPKIATIDKKFFLVDGLLIPGNSGGPILLPKEHKLLSGKNSVKIRSLEHDNFVIGIVSMKTGVPGISIAYPMDYVKEIISDFKYPEN